MQKQMCMVGRKRQLTKADVKETLSRCWSTALQRHTAAAWRYLRVKLPINLPFKKSIALA